MGGYGQGSEGESALTQHVHASMVCAVRQDDDPYVRKTAAVSVVKLFEIDPKMVKEQGFLESLLVRLCARRPGLRAAHPGVCTSCGVRWGFHGRARVSGFDTEVRGEIRFSFC